MLVLPQTCLGAAVVFGLLAVVSPTRSEVFTALAVACFAASILLLLAVYVSGV